MEKTRSEKEMLDHAGNVWLEEDPGEWLAPLDGSIALHTITPGTRIRLIDYGRGPYREDGSPDLENGARKRQWVKGVLLSFEREVVDDGLYETMAVVCDDKGAKHWFSLYLVGPPTVTEEGIYQRDRLFNASGEVDLASYAKGAEIV